MGEYDDLLGNIPPFSSHKARRRMKRIDRIKGPLPPLTEAEQAEAIRIEKLFDHWAKTGKVFTIPDVPLSGAQPPDTPSIGPVTTS
jgi:hypothetical protein